MITNLFTKHTKAISQLNTRFRNSLLDQIQWNERLVGIKGARGVGKTTLMLQHIKEVYGIDRSCLYVNLDDIAFPYESLVQLAEEFEKAGGKHLFIDEIHKYSNWSQELKNIYDSFPDLHVVFTGSSILDILRGKADLSRRAVVYHMQGLSFREFLQIESGKQFEPYTLNQILENHEKYAMHIIEQVKPFQHFDNYLRYGYYPYYLENVINYSLKLSSTINLIIETDMPLFLNIDIQYINKLKRFLNLLSSNIPFKPNVSNLAANIGLSWQSVINYINHLNEAEIIKTLYAEGKSIKSLSKPEMIYLHHPNHFYVFTDEISNKGNFRETFFVNQLSYKHKVETAKYGDFVVNGKYYFEIGGKNKTYQQIANIPNSYIAADNIEFGFENKIPLWLFGFLY
jgi:predicted AAA+ superfamily ATPase